MKRFAFLTTIFSIIVLSITLQAEGIFCGFDPEEPMASISRDELFGECKVLVIAATCPEDIDSGWTTLDLPQWLTDSFIAPTISDVNTAQYKWSLSNFWAAASGEQYWHVGNVNPGNNGHYFISDSTLTYRDSVTDSIKSRYTISRFIKHILIKADSVIDFSDYDYWPNGAGDGVVDYICILLPRNPKDNWPFSIACYGKPGILVDTVLDGVEITSERGFRNGSTAATPANGYARDPMVTLAAHEQGHNLSNDELDDWYDTGSPIEMVDTDNDGIKDSITQYHNLYAASSPLGWYSIMNLAGQPHAIMYSAPEMAKLPWADVTVVEENLQNVELDDMLDGLEILKVPISSSEAFYVSSHLHTSSKYKHWEELMSDSGVLIWHEKLTFPAGYYPGASASELASKLDLECAGGKWDSSGVDTTGMPSPELGWDRLNQYVGFAPSWMQWNANHGGATTNSDDFFREGYKTAFHTLTNPNSDACFVSAVIGQIA